MVQILAVMSGKGGVGKTTISALIGCIMAEKGNTLMLDFDITGPSLHGVFPVTERIKKAQKGLVPAKIKENLFLLSMGLLMKDTDAVIWRGPKKISLLNIFLESIDGFEYVVIDMPPGLSDEHEILINKNVTAIIITTPQNIALSDTTITIEFCKNNNIQIGGLIENFSGYKCENCGCKSNIFAAKGGYLLAEDYGIRFITSLSINPNVSRITDSNTFFIDYNKIEKVDLLRNFLFNCYCKNIN